MRNSSNERPDNLNQNSAKRPPLNPVTIRKMPRNDQNILPQRNDQNNILRTNTDSNKTNSKRNYKDGSSFLLTPDESPTSGERETLFSKLKD